MTIGIGSIVITNPQCRCSGKYPDGGRWAKVVKESEYGKSVPSHWACTACGGKTKLSGRYWVLDYESEGGGWAEEWLLEVG